MADIENYKKTEKLKMKKKITKNEAVMIADAVKSGMSIKVMNDLKELENASSKVLLVKQF